MWTTCARNQSMADIHFEWDDIDIVRHMSAEVARVLKLDARDASHVALQSGVMLTAKHALAEPLIDTQAQLWSVGIGVCKEN